LRRGCKERVKRGKKSSVSVEKSSGLERRRGREVKRRRSWKRRRGQEEFKKRLRRGR
jgi:hypothetical protein